MRFNLRNHSSTHCIFSKSLIVKYSVARGLMDNPFQWFLIDKNQKGWDFEPFLQSFQVVYGLVDVFILLFCKSWIGNFKRISTKNKVSKTYLLIWEEVIKINLKTDFTLFQTKRYCEFLRASKWWLIFTHLVLYMFGFSSIRLKIASLQDFATLDWHRRYCVKPRPLFMRWIIFREKKSRHDFHKKHLIYMQFIWNTCLKTEFHLAELWSNHSA